MLSEIYTYIFFFPMSPFPFLQSFPYQHIEAETRWRPFSRRCFQMHFGLNENAWISIKISLRFVSKGPINNIPALIQILAWHRPGDKPLSELLIVKLPMQICVTRPQWGNLWQISNKSGPIHSWNTSISQFYLKIPRSRSYVGSKIKVTLWV